MPSPTGRRAGRKPQPGARFMADVIGDNLRVLRAIRRLSQDDIAVRMRHLGHRSWSRATVSEVERGGRNTTVDEALALALTLTSSLRDLLTPLGITGHEAAPIDFAAGHRPMAAEIADSWVTGRAALKLRWDGNEADRYVYEVDERPEPSRRREDVSADPPADELEETTR